MRPLRQLAAAGSPASPTRETPPARDEVELPLRGKALRDRIVLRIIAIDRAFHFIVLAALAVAVFLFARNEVRARDVFYRVVNAIDGTSGGTAHTSRRGIVHTLEHVFALKSSTLYAVAAAAAAYAVLEGVEAVGLWYQKRWAEYLTFIATLVFIPVRGLRARTRPVAVQAHRVSPEHRDRALPAAGQAPLRTAWRRARRRARARL